MAEFSGFDDIGDGMFSDEVFISSGLAAEKLKEDEEQFEQDHMLDGMEASNALYNSIQDVVGPQDVTRPSWLSCDKERISIGTYMRGRSAPINEVMSPATVPIEEVVTKQVGKEASKSPGPAGNSVIWSSGAEKNIPQHQSLSGMQRFKQTQQCPLRPPTTIGNDSTTDTLSLSVINRVLSDTSITDGMGYMLQKLVHATKRENGRIKKRRRSSKSEEASCEKPGPRYDTWRTSGRCQPGHLQTSVSCSSADETIFSM